MLASLFLLAALPAQEPVELKVTEAARIGALGSAVELSLPLSMAVLPDGSVVIAERDSHRLRWVSGDGRLLGSFGRQGRGPGEFQGVSAVRAYGDTVVAQDLQSFRTTVLVDKQAVDVISGVAFEGGGLPSPPSDRLPDGSWIAEGLTRSRDAAEPVPVLRLSVDGAAILDTVAMLNRADRMGIGVDESSGLRIYILNALHGGDLWTLVPGTHRLVVLSKPLPQDDAGANAAIRVYDSTGALLRTIRFSGAPTPIPVSAFKNEVQGWTERAMRNRPFPREAVEAAVDDAIDEHPFNPLFDRLVPASDGTLWLREGSFGRDSARWIRITLDGAILNTLTLPEAEDILAAGPDSVWIVRLTELEIPLLIRYEFESAR